MKYTIGEKVTLGPLPPSDESNLYGAGYRAWRANDGAMLSWDGGGIASRIVHVQISTEEFERLRADPSAFHEIALAHESAATDLLP